MKNKNIARFDNKPELSTFEDELVAFFCIQEIASMTMKSKVMDDSMKKALNENTENILILSEINWLI